MARPHAPVFTDDSGVRRVTVQWGGRAIAVACVALWAALALTLGTQVSLPGLDRMPSLSDGIRRVMFPDSRMKAVPDADRRPVERVLVSGVEIARTSPRPVDDSSKVRAEVVPQRTTRRPDQTKAAIKGSGTEPGPSVRTRSAAAKPVATVPANPNSRKPAHASGPPTVKPNPHANPRAKAVVAQGQGARQGQSGPERQASRRQGGQTGTSDQPESPARKRITGRREPRPAARGPGLARAPASHRRSAGNHRPTGCC